MFELVLRIGFSLLVVFGLMWVLAKAVRRPLGSKRAAGSLAVLNRQQLSRVAAVTVVRVGDKALILGVTDQQVSLLGETELAAFEKPPQDSGHRAPVEPSLYPSLDYQSAEPSLYPSLEHQSAEPSPSRGLDGSILAPRTWRSTLQFLRDRTTRR